MATKFLDLDGLKYFKNKMDAAYTGKYVPQGITINGVALNKTGITINDDTKLSKTDATSTWIEVPTEDMYVGGTEPTAEHTIWLEVSE